MQELTKEEYEYRRNHAFDPKYLRHVHRFKKFGEPQCFDFCLARNADECDHRSHGGVRVQARCSICGEVRNFNVNGDYYDPKGEILDGWLQ